MRRALVAFALAVLPSVALSPAWGCEAAGPNTHMGVVTAVGGGSVTLKDAETGKNITFVAAPAQLKGVAVKDQVTIKFTPEGSTLRATSVTKAGG